MENYVKIGLGVVGIAALYLLFKKRENEIAKIHYSIGVKDNNKAMVKLEQKLTEKYNLKEEEVKKLSNALERSEKAFKRLLHVFLLLKDTNNLNKNITEKELLELIDAPLSPEVAKLVSPEVTKNTKFSFENFEIDLVKNAILSNA